MITFDVSLIAPKPFPQELRDLEQRGLKLVELPFQKSNPTLSSLIATLLLAIKVAIKEKNTVFQIITIFPILFFGLPLRLLGRKTLYVMSGLGTIYTTDTLKNKFLRHILNKFYAFLFRGDHSRVVVQNNDDYEHFQKVGVPYSHINLIPGSGLDPDNYPFTPYQLEKKEEPIILVPGRLIREKGVLDALDVSKKLLAMNCQHKMLFAGDIYPGNPTSLRPQELDLFQNENPSVKFLGHVKNMVPLFQQASIILFPSYREGLPKAIMEAFSIGRPVVCYDAIGVRDIVKKNVTGYQCATGDTEALALLTAQILRDRAIALPIIENARKFCLETFHIKKINNSLINACKAL